MLARRISPAIVAAVLVCAAPALGRAAPDSTWEATLENVARGVVVLRVSVPRAFDTDLPATETATGFVVDAERGLILTNRHVVKSGPVVAEAVFLDHEEVEVTAVYRDPVHDFGFYRYDPADVRFMRPAELALRPDHARVGTQLRVVGNDAGEQLSILAGTLARIDRDAPNYGRGRYNDFNTFYYQAASGASGGSSGSPVVDVHGHAIALNAGGKRSAASSYYLPLDRVARALDRIRAGEPVERGTIQTVFRYRPYDELRRLGLRSDTEASVRRRLPDATGLLVVDEIVPEGPGAEALEVGDVLLRVDGTPAAGFVDLESRLDERVGGEVVLDIERAGAPLTVSIAVGDLHAITPDRYVEIGGGVVHPLSYQRARSYAIPVSGLQLATAGYMFGRAHVPRGVVITEVAAEPVRTLDEFEAVMASLPDGARVTIRFFAPENSQTDVVRVATVDRRWFPMQRCVRDDATGRWPCVASPPPPRRPPPESGATTFTANGEKVVRTVAPSLVMVDFDVPYRLDGIHAERFRGAGLVVDAERGLVVVDRETVPVTLGDVRLVFAGSLEVPGRVVALHPVHNLAVVAYDPVTIGDTPVRPARFRDDALSPGDDVWLVGLSERHEVVSRRTEVARVQSPYLPLTDPPRFRESNIELIGLTETARTVGGVIADDKGRVRALWTSVSSERDGKHEAFFAGIAAEQVLAFVGPLRAGKPVVWPAIGAELRPITLADARNRGLPDARARELRDHTPGRRQALEVVRTTAGTAAATLLEEGDVLLQVDGRPVTSHAEVERAARGEILRVVILRNGREHSLAVPTHPLSGAGTNRAVLWAGAVLQRTPWAAADQRGIPPEGVYVSWHWFGSPAHRYRLRSTSRIVAVDGVPTPDLDAFLAASAGRGDRDAVRLATVDLDGRPDVITLKLDLEFWPTLELRRDAAGTWTRSAAGRGEPSR